jgi:hypothetical protein
MKQGSLKKNGKKNKEENMDGEAKTILLVALGMLLLLSYIIVGYWIVKTKTMESMWLRIVMFIFSPAVFCIIVGVFLVHIIEHAMNESDR